MIYRVANATVNIIQQIFVQQKEDLKEMDFFYHVLFVGRSAASLVRVRNLKMVAGGINLRLNVEPVNTN